MIPTESLPVYSATQFFYASTETLPDIPLFEKDTLPADPTDVQPWVVLGGMSPSDGSLLRLHLLWSRVSSLSGSKDHRRDYKDPERYGL